MGTVAEVVQPAKRPRTANISLAQFASSETRAEMGQPIDPAPKTSTDDSLRKVLAVSLSSLRWLAILTLS